MTVKELIQELLEFYPEMPVVICNLQDDGDGEGMADLHEIVSVDKDLAIHDGRNMYVIFINYNK